MTKPSPCTSRNVYCLEVAQGTTPSQSLDIAVPEPENKRFNPSSMV